MVYTGFHLEGGQLAPRAQAGVSFFVPDSSPMLKYSDNDWTTGYAAQPNGFDQTLHMTSSSGSRVSFNLAATSLTLLVPAFENCTSTISINSSNPISACSTRSATTSTDVPFSLYSLPLGAHSVVWDVGNMPTDTSVVFWGIDASRPAEQGGFPNVTIDDTYSRSSDGGVKLEYAGSWDSVRQGSQADLTEKDSLDQYYNKTVAVTKQRGASVAFTGAGSAVYLYGNVGPDYGSATISLNDQVVESSINLSSPWPMPYELLWFRAGLDPSVTTEIVMTNLADSKMALDFVLFTTSPETIAKITPAPPSESFTDTLAGKIVLFFLLPFIIVTGLALFFFFYIRRRRSRKLQLSSDHRPQFSQGSDAEFKFPGSDTTRWSAEPKSSRYSIQSEPSDADLVFVSYDEGKGQRMSEHWNKSASSPPSNWNHEEEIMSPRSGSNRSGLSRSPPMELRSLPQSIHGSVMPNPSIFEDQAGGSGSSDQYHASDEQSETQSTWGPQYQSATSRYPTSVFPASRRGTLPAYTSDEETPPASAIGTENATFDSAMQEKLKLQTAYSGCTTPQTESPSSPVAGPSRPVTQAQKPNRLTQQSGALSITSVFGAPPSEWRQSVPPTPAPPPHLSLPRPPSRFTLTRKPVPDIPGSPNTSRSPSASAMPYDNSPESTKVHPKSSTTPQDHLNRAIISPPSSFQIQEQVAGGSHGRNRSLGGISYKTNSSAARPDSDVIPFEDFITSLDDSPSETAREDVFGLGKQKA